MGEGVGSFGWGATTGVGSAFFAAEPSGFLIACGFGAGLGGWIGGGGGGSSILMVVSCSTARVNVRMLSPDRMTNASATWTATTPAIAFALSGLSAVPR
jgi:hypothetical protein